MSNIFWTNYCYQEKRTVLQSYKQWTIKAKQLNNKSMLNLKEKKKLRNMVWSSKKVKKLHTPHSYIWSQSA